VTAPTGTRARTDGGIGTDASRPDGTLKVTGEFAYGSDLWADEMLWGVTLRSPHPSARIRSVDLGPALAVPGVYAVLTADDVPGEKRYGLEVDDQPVLATGVVRYQGEPVALVAAEHPETARRAGRAHRRRLRGARPGHRRAGPPSSPGRRCCTRRRHRSSSGPGRRRTCTRAATCSGT
jgi:CO/xanthine dehydrogenase Mo-binding subunit